MSKILKTKIDGYSVELETGIDSDPSTECWIEKGKFSASLAGLAMTGELNSRDFSTVHVVHPQTIEAIEQWAEENGY